MKNLPQNPQAFYELQNGFSGPDWISDVKETPAIDLLMWLIYSFHEKYKDKATDKYSISYDEEYDFFIKKIGLMLLIHLVPEICKSGLVGYRRRDIIPPLVYLASNEYMSDMDTLVYVSEEKHPNSLRVNNLLGSKEFDRMLSKISPRLPEAFVIRSYSIDWDNLVPTMLQRLTGRSVVISTVNRCFDIYIPKEKLLGLFVSTNYYFYASWPARFISNFDKIKEFYYADHYDLNVRFLNVSKNCRIKASLRAGTKCTEFLDVCFDPQRCIGYQNLQTSVVVYTLNGTLEWNTRLPEVSSEICNRLDDFIRKHHHKHQPFKKDLNQK